MTTSATRIYTMKADPSDLDRYNSCLHMGDSIDAILELSRAIASSPLWSEMPEATLIVRRSPPVIAVLGKFDEAGEARLEALARQIKNGISTMRYVDYSQLEEDCRLLAKILIEHFGPDKVTRFYFTAIPRGGIMALGILSYILGLKQRQLDPPFSPDVPLVIVDDCALTGSRLGNFLRSCSSNKIVFAPLYSHPELRSNIEAQEPKVMACLSARDLNDHWDDPGESKIALQKLWLSRLGGRRYWFGHPDYVCFAWNEPDQLFWNPISKKVESGWHLLPPELCLKNNSKPIPVQIQPEGIGPLCPTNRVLFARYDGQIVIGNMDSGECFSLEGVAAEMWNAIIDYGDLDKVTDRLLRDYTVDETSLRRDLELFVEDLKARSLLEERYG